MGKRRIVAETGAGQHGVATATVCALLGLECHVYMGSDDMARQSLNVFRMRLLGAEVIEVNAGSRTLKDAINEAMRDWVTNVTDTYYLLGSVLGPHPYPLMVREFQSVIGREARAQCLEQFGRLPDAVVACVGGGSNAMGIFDAFIDDRKTRLIGVEAGRARHHAGRARGAFRRRQRRRAAGHAQLRAAGRGRQRRARRTRSRRVSTTPRSARSTPGCARSAAPSTPGSTTTAALDAFQRLGREEGILPALESSHAIAHACRLAPAMAKDAILLVNLSGRGDKDVLSVQAALEGGR